MNRTLLCNELIRVYPQQQYKHRDEEWTKNQTNKPKKVQSDNNSKNSDEGMYISYPALQGKPKEIIHCSY